MGKSASGVPAAKLELYERLVATNPSVERKGATTPYTLRNGHMFSFMTKRRARWRSDSQLRSERRSCGGTGPSYASSTGR